MERSRIRRKLVLVGLAVALVASEGRPTLRAVDARSGAGTVALADLPGVEGAGVAVHGRGPAGPDVVRGGRGRQVL